MRRTTLAPPRPARGERHAPRAAGPGSPAADRAPSPHVAQLPPPKPATARPRHLLDPAHGWFRSVERETNLWLSRRLWSRVPGTSRPYGALLERKLTLSEAEVKVRGLPVALDRVQVLLLTDIHTGPFLAPSALGRALGRLLSVQPDLILVGGDVATARLEDVLPHLEALRTLRAPLGVYGVLGNHDHYTGDLPRLRAVLSSAGIRLLENEAVRVEKDGAVLALAGLDDLVWGRPDLDRALASAAEVAPRAPVILLSHNPDVFFEAERRGVALVLAGHTHGGQIRVPGLPVLVRMSRYRLDEGRYVHGDSELVVSRGLGVTGLPFRAACPPEAVLIALRA